jgi:hypothetical protein
LIVHHHFLPEFGGASRLSCTSYRKTAAGMLSQAGKQAGAPAPCTNSDCLASVWRRRWHTILALKKHKKNDHKIHCNSSSTLYIIDTNQLLIKEH